MLWELPSVIIPVKIIGEERRFAINRVKFDLPKWLLDVLDKKAIMLNISRQAVAKTWLADRADKIKESKKGSLIFYFKQLFCVL